MRQRTAVPRSLITTILPVLKFNCHVADTEQEVLLERISDTGHYSGAQSSYDIVEIGGVGNR